MIPRWVRSRAVLAVVVSLVFGGCPSGKHTKAPIGAPGPAVSADEAKLEPGLNFRISEGAEEPEGAVKRPPPAKATPIDKASTDAILGRLPALVGDANDQKDFAMRERSLPPPKTGKLIKDAFPPPPPEGAANPQSDKPGPLEIVRTQPEGDVPVAPHVSITFSQPMVPVTSHDDLAARGVPLTMTPTPPGAWQWIGTKTLLFKPTVRMPMATTYTVEIPAGTKSEIGGALAAKKTFTFQTPAPTLIMQGYPWDGPTRLDPVMFAAFDQKIDPAAVLKTIHVTAAGKTYTLRLATDDEVKADPVVKELAAQQETAEHHGRWLAFVATEKFPVQTGVSVQIGPGTPSAEGPRVTDKSQDFGFETYGPMKVVEARCGWDGQCHPTDWWSIEFTNPIDEKKLDKKTMITVDPPLASMKVQVSGNYLAIQGRSKGRTTYKVTLAASVPDTFGQTLGGSDPLIFKVGDAPQSLYANGGEFQVLDPAGGGKFSVYSTNHKKLKVRVYQVTPSDWEAYAAYMRDWQRDRKLGALPGKKVVDTTVEIKGEPDDLTETALDLSPALTDKHGQAIVIIEPTTQPRERWEWQIIQSWVQVTDIGLDAFVDARNLTAWATNLKDGKPLSGVDLELIPHNTTAKSGADGTTVMPLGAPVKKDMHLLVARKGSDLAILPEHTYWWSEQGGWRKRSTTDQMRWFVYNDRGMYKPGEEVHWKGWLRRYGADVGGDIGGIGGAAKTISYKVSDSRGNEILKGDAKLGAMGGFDFAFKLPGTVNLGSTYMELHAGGGTGGATPLGGADTVAYFQVQEFRRPEFEVTASASEGPFVVGDHATITVNASYYAGGGLPGAPVYWNVTASPGMFSPPGHDEYTFGTWVPWWGWGYGEGDEGDENGGSQYKYKNLEGKTDPKGAHHIRLDFDGIRPPRATSVVAQASVTDVNRQAWGASATILVHPADEYVGLKSDRMFVNEGDPLPVDAIVTDLDGKLDADKQIDMTSVMLDWSYENGKYKQIEGKPETCTVKSGPKDPVRCTFHPAEGGTYRVRASIHDAKGRRNETEITLWVAGAEKAPPTRGVEQQRVTLIPSKKEYRADETADILVQSPFGPAEGVVTYRRSGLVKTERFTMKSSSMTLHVPILGSYTPNLYVQVDLVGSAMRTNDVGEPQPKLPKRPAYASGSLNLSIPPYERKLNVTVHPEKAKTEPGTEQTVEVDVRDAAGRPVPNAEVAVVVVDEAILSLTGYRVPDPLDTFYSQRGGDVGDYHMRQYIVLAKSTDLAENMNGDRDGDGVADDVDGVPEEQNARMGAAAGSKGDALGEGFMGKKEKASDKPAEEPAAPSPDITVAKPPGQGQPPAIQMRTNFDALALFDAAEPTDASGKARVKVKLPDNLTRYRIMVASVAGEKQFGLGESTITARLPLMVRPSPPRFLNFGDVFELPVVLQNQTDKDMTVDVAARVSNLTLAGDGLGKRVTVPANDRVEVRFAAETVKAGTARFQIGAIGDGKWTDAAMLDLPVWTPATTEAFATYGEIDKGAITQPVKPPSNVFSQFGGLEISTTSTALGELTDAVLYLESYPFEDSEELASRSMAIAELKDVLGAFQAKGLPTEAEMTARVAKDVDRLKVMQNYDGGFGFWSADDDSFPYLTVHVTHALVRIKQKGYQVDDYVLSRAQNYLQNVESYIPYWYPDSVRWAIIAYALYTRDLMGDHDVARAQKLIDVDAKGADKLPLEANGWLLSMLTDKQAAQAQVAALRKNINNHVEETSGLAHFTSGYGDGAYLLLSSDRRVDAIVLEALMKDQPKSDLISKVVKDLLAHRVAGRWESTQENVFVLLAMDQYFHAYENVTPDFVARAWLGDTYAGDAKYKGRTTDKHEIDVPMAWLVGKGGLENLVLQKDGAGRLYYRIGMSYAPKNLKLDPSDHGFVVQRSYEAVDKPDDVTKDADGVWHVKAGAKVRVRLTMVAQTRRYHVALVDAIPAGLEAMNPELAVTGNIPKDPKQAQQAGGDYWYWAYTWYQHQNLRDERVEAFTTLLWEGVWDYDYVARATTPGTFIVPPAKAEEMYHPETFGRSASDKLIVEE